MNKNHKLILDILNAGLNNQKLDLSNEHDNKELITIMREQTFLPYLYYVSKDTFYNAYYISSYLIHEQFIRLKRFIKMIFDKNQIDHIFLKGSSLQDLYPDRNLRLLGDIDVLVREKDINKAIKVFKENGFIFDERADHHISFKYKNLEIELHHRIVEYNHPLYHFFKEPFANASVEDNHTYALDNDYNLVFIISHYLKHLRNGSGLRSLCDIYLMMLKKEINIDKVYQIFIDNGYEKFFICVLSAIDIIFAYRPFEFENSPYAEELISYSLNSGIHGFGANNDYIKNRQVSVTKNRFVYLLKTWFVPIKVLFSYYPWTKSIILIPFGYIARLFHLLIHRRKKLKHIMTHKNSDDLFFKHIGIK